MNINPQQLEGNWKEGFALDLHTLHSTPIDWDEFGNILHWETERTPIGAALYRFKYGKEYSQLPIIVATTIEFLKTKIEDWKIDLIVPVHPSDTTRHIQPVYEMAKAIGSELGIPVDFASLKKIKSTSQLKSENDPAKRKEILEGAFSVVQNCFNEKNVLLFDDLFRSGDTLREVCKILSSSGDAKAVYVLTITKTRTKR